MGIGNAGDGTQFVIFCCNYLDIVITELMPRRITDARYPMNLWNVTERIELEITRVNNSVESWHLVWNKLMLPHPPFSVLIRNMIEENDRWGVLIEEYNIAPANGIRTYPRHAKDVKRDRNIVLLYQSFVAKVNYTEKSVFSYLKDIARFLK